jgi:hypothetical protein
MEEHESGRKIRECVEERLERYGEWKECGGERLERTAEWKLGR